MKGVSKRQMSQARYRVFKKCEKAIKVGGAVTLTGALEMAAYLETKAEAAIRERENSS